MISVLIADDHTILRSGLKEILAMAPEFKLMGEASNGNEVLSALRQEVPDVLMMDMNMPGVSGIDLIERVKSSYPTLILLVLTMLDDVQTAARTIKAGADGYITKDRSPEELISALRKVAAGGKYIEPRLAEQMLFNPADIAGVHSKLSSREQEVFLLLVKGESVNSIAERLFISNKTVSTHKVKLLEKMGLKNTTELVRYAVQYDLFS